jgi:CBS-domain-containing membrane protein
MVEHGLGHCHCCNGSNAGWGYIGLPVAVGSLMLVMIAWLYQRLPPRIIYPTPEQE